MYKSAYTMDDKIEVLALVAKDGMNYFLLNLSSDLKEDFDVSLTAIKSNLNVMEIIPNQTFFNLDDSNIITLLDKIKDIPIYERSLTINILQKLEISPLFQDFLKTYKNYNPVQKLDNQFIMANPNITEEALAYFFGKIMKQDTIASFNPPRINKF